MGKKVKYIEQTQRTDHRHNQKLLLRQISRHVYLVEITNKTRKERNILIIARLESLWKLKELTFLGFIISAAFLNVFHVFCNGFWLPSGILVISLLRLIPKWCFSHIYNKNASHAVSNQISYADCKLRYKYKTMWSPIIFYKDKIEYRQGIRVTL